MSDPGKHTAAQIRYELKILYGPFKFDLRGLTFESKTPSEDTVVIVRQTIQPTYRGDWLILDETIVGVIGDKYRSGTSEFLKLRAFLNAGGIIGLNRRLCD